MFLNKFITKLLKKFLNENFDILKLNKKDQKEKLILVAKSIRNLDFVNRSFAQYKCQIFFYSNSNRFILNIVSIFLLPIFLVFSLLNYFFIKSRVTRDKYSNFEKDVAVFFGVNKYIIPQSLKKYNIIDSKFCFALNLESLIFLTKEVYLKFFYYPYFCFKITLKVALYNANMIINKPKVIIATSEYSFTSSLLTYYCEFNNCKHINVMHGEKLFYIRDSFFRFHKCYVWHEHYVNLFKSLMAEQGQFIVELPFAFSLKKTVFTPENISDKKILKYFLGGETKEQLYNLSKFLKLLQKDYYITIRPHPIYSEAEEINEIFDGILIENPKEVPITDSLLSADFICAFYSTVLFQGYCLGKKIVINNLNEKMYEKLKELDFIGFDLPHLLLTNFLGG